jgi:hypothetical protein
MQKLVLFFVALFSFIHVATAQKSKIEGKIIGSTNGEPLIGATVTVEGTKKSTQSDQNGYFLFFGIRKGHI